MPRLVECPAIKTLAGLIRQHLPGVKVETLVNIDPGTRHTSGLAADIYFDATKPVEKRRGLDLIDVLVARIPEMRWSDLIFTDFHIGGGRGGYSGNGRDHQAWTRGGHQNHIHIDWVDLNLMRTGPEGSAAFRHNPWEWDRPGVTIPKDTQWADALGADLAALAARWAGSGTPIPTVTLWLAGWWRVFQEGETYYYHVANDGRVGWTYRAPAGGGSPAPADPRNQGRLTLQSLGAFELVWDEVGGMSTIETFSPVAQGSFRGKSNRAGPLTMDRL